MSLPTVYFPNVFYVLSEMKLPRKWSTMVNDSPGGARQKRALYSYPKRMLQATVYTSDGTSQYLGTVDSFAAMRRFLDAMKGEFGTFYIFNPKQQDFDHALDVRQALCGTFNTTFPMTCPFAGGTITAIYKNGVLYKSAGSFVQDALGAGGETRIASVTGGLPANGDIISVNVTGAKERIAVAMLGDVDNIALDPAAADPTPFLSMNLQEEFVV
jgi:hypothetical protein